MTYPLFLYERQYSFFFLINWVTFSKFCSKSRIYKTLWINLGPLLVQIEIMPLPSLWTISLFSSLTLVLIALSSEMKRLESLAMWFVHPLSTYHTSFELEIHAWESISKFSPTSDYSLVKLTWCVVCGWNLFYLKRQYLSMCLHLLQLLHWI